MIRRIQKAAVIGSGVMGGGIAALLAGAGIPTLLLDIVPLDLQGSDFEDPAARNRIVAAGLKNIKAAKPAALMTPGDASLISIGNLEDDFDKLAECDWIVEVVVEKLEIKQALCRRLETVRKADAIVTTNTSGIPLRDISAGLSTVFRQHFMGTHFFNPVRYMHLLELIPGEETLPEILTFIADFGRGMLGKGIVWAKDTPNFIANRVGVHSSAHVFDAMAMSDDLTIPEVDALLGPAIGRPKTAIFKLGDLVGVDLISHVAANTYSMVKDDEEREKFKVPAYIDRMVEKGLLGNKSGSGFYRKEKDDQGQRVVKVINPGTLTYETFEKPKFACLQAAAKCATLPEKMCAVVYGQDRGARFAWKYLAASLIYSANRIPDISDTIVEVDNAMRWGYNFALGPFEAWDAIGVARSVERMRNEKMAVPEKVTQMLAAGHDTFYKLENGRRFYYDFTTRAYQPAEVDERALSLHNLKAAEHTVQSCSSGSLVDLGDGVFCCEFHTKMNALNAELVDFIHQSIDYVNGNGVGLVIGNQAAGAPPAFSAGADLNEMVTAALEGRFDQIAMGIRHMQGALQRARYAPFPVVAAPFGLALGGGCEIGLAADRMVAHAELYMGLVEIGVGLLPGGGGCLNLWKKVCGNIPTGVANVNLMPFFVTVFQNIATAKVSTSAADARVNGFLGPRDRIVFNADNLIGEAKREVLRMVSDGYAAPAKKKIKVFGQTAQGLVNAQLSDMQRAGYVSEYDAFLARRIAYVISGGDVAPGSEIDETVILKLEEETFLALLNEEKTRKRIEHMLKTGKPLRN